MMTVFRSLILCFALLLAENLAAKEKSEKTKEKKIECSIEQELKDEDKYKKKYKNLLNKGNTFTVQDGLTAIYAGLDFTRCDTPSSDGTATRLSDGKPGPLTYRWLEKLSKDFGISDDEQVVSLAKCFGGYVQKNAKGIAKARKDRESFGKAAKAELGKITEQIKIGVKKLPRLCGADALLTQLNDGFLEWVRAGSAQTVIGNRLRRFIGTDPVVAKLVEEFNNSRTTENTGEGDDKPGPREDRETSSSEAAPEGWPDHPYCLTKPKSSEAANALTYYKFSPTDLQWFEENDKIINDLSKVAAGATPPFAKLVAALDAAIGHVERICSPPDLLAMKKFLQKWSVETEQTSDEKPERKILVTFANDLKGQLEKLSTDNKNLIDDLKERSEVIYPNERLASLAFAKLWYANPKDPDHQDTPLIETREETLEHRNRKRDQERVEEGHKFRKLTRREGNWPAQPLAFESVGCGCVRDFSSLTYGILPLWIGTAFADAGDDQSSTDPIFPDDGGSVEQRKVEPLKIDFSRLSRIGFEGVRVNDQGRLDRRAWSADLGATLLLAEAHRYNTKVDIVVDIQSWWAWLKDDSRKEKDLNEEDLNERRQRLAGHIAALLGEPPDPANTLGSDAPKLGFLQEWHASSGPDGITLKLGTLKPEDFDVAGNSNGSSESKTSTARELLAFVKAIREAMNDRAEDATLNLMIDLPLHGMTKQEEETARILNALAPLVVLPDDGKLPDALSWWKSWYSKGSYFHSWFGTEVKQAPIDFMVVTLEEPTTDAKKFLRQTLEAKEAEATKGPRRVEFLRKIVPVIPPTGHHLETDPSLADEPYPQLRDDLVYFRDNFAGVGFWPLPLRLDGEAEEFDNLQDLISRAIGPNPVPFPDGTVCSYVCPNRLPFRIIFVGLGLFLAGMALTARFSCAFSDFLVAYLRRPNLCFWIWVSLWVAAWLTFLSCDPHWVGAWWPTLVIYGLVVAGTITGQSFSRFRRGRRP